MDNRPGVTVGILSNGWICEGLCDALMRMSHDPRYRLVVTFSWARPIPSNRQLLVRGFLESDHDYLIMIDRDVWPYRNLLDLIAADKDVVFFPVPVYRPGMEEPPIVSVLTPLDGGAVDFDEGPFKEVESGGSVFIIARRVLEALPQPIFEYQFDEWGMMTVEEDINFCRKARAAGFRLWAAYTHPCGHIKEVDLVDMHGRVREWS